MPAACAMSCRTTGVEAQASANDVTRLRTGCPVRAQDAVSGPDLVKRRLVVREEPQLLPASVRPDLEGEDEDRLQVLGVPLADGTQEDHHVPIAGQDRLGRRDAH